ncbi:hypothetical protein A9Q81_08260 [Gammaproteobacteria bacterium 42_54_T18]|nr:hypothetical protein A9Q81_08260 [Gammaproteobacteria bacterium 42_54_T18]
MEVSEYNGISHEDVATVKAILHAFYGSSMSRRVTSTSVSDETIHQVAVLLAETIDCSQWSDAVPSPKDLLMPAKSLQKWALRLVRNAGKPFLDKKAEVTWGCRNFRAAQFKPMILETLM